jgi:hypothetical protein
VRLLLHRPAVPQERSSVPQQWLQIAGSLFDGRGFALISPEWYRGCLELRSKVTLLPAISSAPKRSSYA